MSTESENIARKEQAAPFTSRRAVVKGAAWSLPVVAAAAATPLAAATVVPCVPASTPWTTIDGSDAGMGTSTVPVPANLQYVEFEIRGADGGGGGYYGFGAIIKGTIPVAALAGTPTLTLIAGQRGGWINPGAAPGYEGTGTITGGTGWGNGGDATGIPTGTTIRGGGGGGSAILLPGDVELVVAGGGGGQAGGGYQGKSATGEPNPINEYSGNNADGDLLQGNGGLPGANGVAGGGAWTERVSDGATVIQVPGAPGGTQSGPGAAGGTGSSEAGWWDDEATDAGTAGSGRNGGNGGFIDVTAWGGSLGFSGGGGGGGGGHFGGGGGSGRFGKREHTATSWAAKMVGGGGGGGSSYLLPMITDYSTSYVTSSYPAQGQVKVRFFTCP